MNKNIKVSQLTIDSMKKLGMSKAIERANSGQASEEEVEGARRFYGNRIKTPAKSVAPVSPVGGPKMQPAGPASKEDQAFQAHNAEDRANQAKKAAYEKDQARIKAMPKQFKTGESAL